MREALLRTLCQQRGITITSTGRAYRLTGRGVSLLVTDLCLLSERDLEPVTRQFDDAALVLTTSGLQ